MPELGPTLRIALADLARSDGKTLIKTAIKELVRGGVHRLETIDRPRRLGRRRTRVVLVQGSGRPPTDRIVGRVAAMVSGAPTDVVDGRVVRDLEAVAEHIARQPKVREGIVEAALEELEELGLVRYEERRVLVVIKRRVALRTAEGDRALGREPGHRRTSGEVTDDGERGRDRSYDQFSYSRDRMIVGDPDPGRDLDGLDEGLDRSLGQEFDSSFDSSFDASFDQSFDSAFDSSFDSGFSSGDSGGGGGGDGGGGGGGGE